jgi:hypothetical protein
MRTGTAGRLGLGVAAIAAVVGVTAGAAGGRTPADRVSGNVSVGGLGRDARQGLTMEAETGRSSLSRITVRLRAGAEVRLRPRDKPYAYAKYYLGQTRDTVEFGGMLLVPAGKASGRFVLGVRPLHNGVTRPARVTATLRTGPRPSLVISGLPADTTAFRLSTLHAGTRGTRATHCREDFVSYSGSMRILLRSGRHESGDATGRYVCRNLPPARCRC